VSDTRDPHARPDAGRPADRWLRTCLEDSLLWPVLIAGAGHVRRDWAVPWWLALRAPGAAVAAKAPNVESTQW